MAKPDTPPLQAQLPPAFTPAPLPEEGTAPPALEDPVPEELAPVAPVPVQVDRATFLAARLRETLANEANLRDVVADLQKENARLRAVQAQREIDMLDADYDVGKGTFLQKRPDGTYWRIPPELIQRSQQG